MLTLCLLLWTTEIFNVMASSPRDVLIKGTTLGPNFVRHEGNGAPRCPQTQPWPIDNGSHCCKYFTTGSNDKVLLDVSSPLSDCEDYVTCLDKGNTGYGCRKATIANKTSCPEDHPFAMSKGKFCCKYHRQKDSPPQCNGDIIATSTDPVDCCIDEQFVPCPGKSITCKNHVDATTHCGKNALFSRFGDTGIYKLPSKYTNIETNTKCKEQNGSLPMLRDPAELALMTEYYIAQKFTTVVFGMEVAPGKLGTTCVNAACNDIYQYMEDGELFTYESWMEEKFLVDMTNIQPAGCSRLVIVNGGLAAKKQNCAPGTSLMSIGVCLIKCA